MTTKVSDTRNPPRKPRRRTYEVELHYTTHITLRGKACSEKEAISEAENRVAIAVNYLTEDALDLLWNLESQKATDRVREVREV